MYTKRVWFDQHHQAEIFLNDEEVTIGTIIAYEGAVILVNPTSDILSALYHESKLKRILGIRSIVLTSAAVQYARGICALMNYARVLGRKSPVTVTLPLDNAEPSGTAFISMCCQHLIANADFELVQKTLEFGVHGILGAGELVYYRGDGEGRLLVITTQHERTIHVYDGDHYISSGPDSSQIQHPDIVIREQRGRRESSVSRLAIVDQI